MESIVITIHPPNDDSDSVRALDALEQGADILRLLDAVGQRIAPEGQQNVWQLIGASTNSPLRLEVTVATNSAYPNSDAFVATARDGLLSSLRTIVENGTIPEWMHDDVLPSARNVFRRARHGLGVINIGNGNGKTFSIDRELAESGEIALSVPPSVSVEKGRGEQAQWGEVQGVIVSVGSWYFKPAVRIISRQFEKPLACVLTEGIVATFGADHTLEDVWTGRAVAVRGRLVFRGSSMVRVIATDMRDLPKPERVDIASLRDPDFTGGLDPVEYLRRFHEGELV
jgi:hypothetical protein